MITNPATRPFWVFAGGGIDVREKFGKSRVMEVTKMMPNIGIMTIVFAALTIYLCHDEYKNGKMSSKNFKIVTICEGLAILGMIFLIIS